MADVKLSDDAFEQFKALPKVFRPRVTRITERLRLWPNVSGAKPLTGRLAGHYRVRTGDYRIQFRVEGELIVVEKIGHRDRFYDE